MRIQLCGRRDDRTGPLQEHARRRLHFALGRFNQSIGLVPAGIRQEAVPSRGSLWTCRIAVNLPPQGRILVEEAQPDLNAAISRLAEQAGRALDAQRGSRDVWFRAPAAGGLLL